MKNAFMAAAAVLTIALAPTLGHAQGAPTAPREMPVQNEMQGLTELRVGLVKLVLQLTPDQEKLWPPIEQAIRNRSKERQARIQQLSDRAADIQARGVVAALSERNPVDFLNRRADLLAERAASLKKLAAAWQPLYATLTPDQKRRLTLLTLYGLRELRDAVEQRRLDSIEIEEEEE